MNKGPKRRWFGWRRSKKAGTLSSHERLVEPKPARLDNARTIEVYKRTEAQYAERIEDLETRQMGLLKERWAAKTAGQEGKCEEIDSKLNKISSELEKMSRWRDKASAVRSRLEPGTK